MLLLLLDKCPVLALASSISPKLHEYAVTSCQALHLHSHSAFAVCSTASSEDEKQWLSVCWDLPRMPRPAHPGLLHQPEDRMSGSDTDSSGRVLSTSSFCWFGLSQDPAYLGQGEGAGFFEVP